MDAQGYPIKDNILYQDNKSTIILLNNGKQSSTKHTRAINICYFFLTDQIQKGKLRVAHCPTGQMIANFHSSCHVSLYLYLSLVQGLLHSVG